MKVGDLVKAPGLTGEFGLGIIVLDRPFGGFIVYFPQINKDFGFNQWELEVINEGR